MGDLVEGLVRHAAGQRSIADDRDHEAVDSLAQSRLGDSERVAQRRGGVAVLDDVMLGFLARWIARQPIRLAEARKATRPAGHDLVDVRLVASVPNDRVLGAVENAAPRE